MNEHGFVKAVHRQLPDWIGVWKIKDDYHGGVSDALYLGLEGKLLFVEYKFDPELPVRSTTKLPNAKLKPLQKEWFVNLQERKIPVCAVYGYNQGGVIVTEREYIHGIRKSEFEGRWVNITRIAEWITTQVEAQE